LKQLYKNIFIDKYGNPKIEGLRSPLFWIGLTIKLILSCFFASHFLRQLFAPFINYFVSSGFQNPYLEFTNVGLEEHFPYPTIMLYIMSVPRIIFAPFLSEGVSWFHLFIYRSPLLFFDFVILLILLRWLKTKHKQVLWLYWLSPLVIYINYFHGQLDIIPIGLLMISLYFLFKQQWVWAMVLFALSCATKTNMIIALPFMLIYGAKNKCSWQDLTFYFLIFFSVFAIVQMPYLFNAYYQGMVYQNSVQTKVFDAYLTLGNYQLYFIVSAYIILLFRAITFIKINRNLLLLFLAFSFGVFTLFITPMQGWYLWLVPFFVYFVIQYNEAQKYLYFILITFYFIYFALVPRSDYPILNHISAHQLNISFTLLQTLLALFLFVLYNNGIKNLILQKLNYKPFLIGVGGDSGAGKSTFSTLLENVIGSENLSIVRGDDMHKWERGNENWKTITHLNPKANNIHKDLQDTKDLKEGKAIYRKHYDHNNGKFTLPQFIKSNTLVLFEGLHPFYLKAQANLYDLKIFFQPDESIRIDRKVKRDVQERDKQAQQVIQQLEDRKEDSEKYINNQKEHADIIVNYTMIDGVECLRLYLKNEIEIDNLLTAIANNSEMAISNQYTQDNLHEIIFQGHISDTTIELIAYDELEGLEEIGIYNSIWQPNYKGILQLITLRSMFYYLKV
jgi:uridine kinase